MVIYWKKVKVCIRAKWPIRRALISGFCGMKRLGVCLLTMDGMPIHRRVTPSIKFAGTYLYIWVERGTVRVKCLAQEHNAMSPARVRTRTARSGDERTNHEATAPPTLKKVPLTNSVLTLLILNLLLEYDLNLLSEQNSKYLSTE